MADRSQLPVQIMENQTPFDLNAAIEGWRNELAAQPNLAADDRRELETHLRDAIAEFQQHGLSGEEAFWLARRRVGPPEPLGEEFVKAEPVKVWRERAYFIMLFGQATGSFEGLLSAFREPPVGSRTRPDSRGEPDILDILCRLRRPPRPEMKKAARDSPPFL